MIGALSTPHLMSIKFFRDRRNGLVQQEQARQSGAMPRPLFYIVGNLRCRYCDPRFKTARYAVLVAGCVSQKPHDQEHLVAERDLHRAPQVLPHHRPKGANASKIAKRARLPRP
jgi:hypothetical protein